MKNSIVTLAVATLCGLTNEVQANELEQRLQGVFGNKPIQISEHDQHLKSVAVGSSQYFTTHDGQYLFAGPVIDTERQVDLVAEKSAQVRIAQLNAQPESLFIRYPSSDDRKYQITVFTDIDCRYCRKLHNYMREMNQRGITVDYVMLPRAGIGSESYLKTLSALCSNTPAVAITDAMQGNMLEPRNCDSTPLDQQMSLARELNITSTPSIVLPSGEIRPGLVTPDQLIGLIELANQRSNVLEGTPL